MSTEANPTLGVAERIFKEVAWDPMVDAEVDALLIGAVWLNWWPMNRIARGVAHLIGDRFFNKFDTTVDAAVIVFTNRQHEESYNATSVKLAIIATEQGFDSPEYEKARDEALVEQSQFTRFGAAR